jgi:hypothetical protein
MELEDLRSEYEQHMRVHKLKSSKKTISAAFVVAAEYVTDMVHLQLGRMATKLVEVSEQRTLLLEAELKAPGREVAYLVRCSEEFGPSSPTDTSAWEIV